MRKNKENSHYGTHHDTLVGVSMGHIQPIYIGTQSEVTDACQTYSCISAEDRKPNPLQRLS
jgi:hypothetical protein